MSNLFALFPPFQIKQFIFIIIVIVVILGWSRFLASLFAFAILSNALVLATSRPTDQNARTTSSTPNNCGGSVFKPLDVDLLISGSLGKRPLTKLFLLFTNLVWSSIGVGFPPSFQSLVGVIKQYGACFCLMFSGLFLSLRFVGRESGGTPIWWWVNISKLD